LKLCVGCVHELYALFETLRSCKCF